MKKLGALWQRGGDKHANENRRRMISNAGRQDSINTPFVRAGQGAIDYERWVNQQMDLLKMKWMTSDLTIGGVKLPTKLSEKMFKVSVDGRNTKGETLMIAVIRYICDDLKQVQFLNLLLRMGADPNLGDTKHQRTPIMYACLYKKVAVVRVLMNQPKLLLGVKDRLGNTALMYAALQGEKTIINLLTAKLAKTWSFDILLEKNLKGKTAESMAFGNDKDICAALLRSARVRMLQRMHKQLALIHYSAEVRGWKEYTAAYRAARVWQAKRHGRRLASSLPVLEDHHNQLVLMGKGYEEHTRGISNKNANLLADIYRPRAKSCDPPVE